MPNIKSAGKRIKTSEKSRQRNRAVKSRILTVRKGLAAAVAGGDSAVGRKALKEYFSIVDKAAKKGIITGNTASRQKSRAAARVAKMA